MVVRVTAVLVVGGGVTWPETWIDVVPVYDAESVLTVTAAPNATAGASTRKIASIAVAIVGIVFILDHR